jgi:endoglucanase Acf2
MEWIVYSNMTLEGDTDATSDAYVFDAKSKKMVMAAFGFQFSEMSQALLARMLKSIYKGSMGADKTEKFSVAEHTAESAIPQTKVPIKQSSSKREQHLKVLHEVTDVPVEDLKDDSTLRTLALIYS